MYKKPVEFSEQKVYFAKFFSHDRKVFFTLSFQTTMRKRVTACLLKYLCRYIAEIGSCLRRLGQTHMHKTLNIQKILKRINSIWVKEENAPS